MNRAISGTLAVRETGRPLAGFVVVAVRLAPGGPVVLGISQSGVHGRFRVEYPTLDAPADLTVALFAQNGEWIFTEPVHRRIDGAELQIRLQVSLRRVAPHLDALP